MTPTKQLQVRQRQLLHDWLDTSNGAVRFEILRELRTVEQSLAETVRTSPTTSSTVKIKTYAVR